MKKRLLFLSIFSANILLAEDTMDVITVTADEDTSSTNISSQKINKTLIENSVQGNGFISSLLETNPNIEVTDDSKNSTTAGEITPGKISINDAPFYQNNVQIDGISNDSLIDPNLSNTFDRYDVPGNENETFIDLDLIDSIEVYDSNISAEYGNFTGGVIDAKTVRAKGEPHFKLSYSYTGDDVTEFHVSDEESFNEAGSDNSQPYFRKDFLNAYVSIPIDEKNGIIASYSRKESTIPGAYFDTFADKTRLNQNFFTKWSHYFDDDAVLDVTGTYSPYESTHFQRYTKDSDTKIKGGGGNIKANYEKDFDFWKLNSNLGFKYSQNTKESSNTNKQWINTGSHNWGKDDSSYSLEGGTGNIEKTSQGVNYNLKLNSDSFDTGWLAHKLKTGLALNYNTAKYDRKQNTYYYTDAQSNNRIDCNGDTVGCSYSEQYFQSRRVYDASETDADILATALYLEDKLEYDDWLEFTPGVRFDYNNYLENFDVSYRLNSSIKPFKDNNTVFYGGFNRYYGKSFLGYKLREARTPYYDQYRSSSQNTVGDWGTSADKDSDKYTFSDLDTPYTDEASIGLKQDVLGMRFNVKYVNRKAKNKFLKQKGDYTIYTRSDGTKSYYKPTYFTNGGYSESDIVSLNVGPKEGLDLGLFKLGYSLSTSWRKTSSNSDDYDDILEDESEDDVNKVYYDGNVYDADDLPYESDPKNINLHLNMAFKPVSIFGVKTRINLNNIIRYNLAYDDLFKTDEDETYTYTETLPNGSTEEYELPIYEKVHFKDAVTLDMKLNFDFQDNKKQHLVFSTEVTNVFDKVQNVESSTSKYKTGRQFWFNMTYKF